MPSSSKPAAPSTSPFSTASKPAPMPTIVSITIPILIPIPIPVPIPIATSHPVSRHPLAAIVVAPHPTVHMAILLLLLPIRLDSRFVQILAPLGMRGFALRAVRAKPGQVEHTQLPPNVFLGAQRAQRAEAHVVVRTRRQPRRRVDVQVEALLAVGAVPVPHEEVALGHLAKVVFVQELAVLTLFAEPA